MILFFGKEFFTFAPPIYITFLLHCIIPSNSSTLGTSIANLLSTHLLSMHMLSYKETKKPYKWIQSSECKTATRSEYT